MSAAKCGERWLGRAIPDVASLIRATILQYWCQGRNYTESTSVSISKCTGLHYFTGTPRNAPTALLRGASVPHRSQLGPHSYVHPFANAFNMRGYEQLCSR